MGEPDDIDDIDEEVMEVIESEDEDEAADEDVDEDAEAVFSISRDAFPKQSNGPTLQQPKQSKSGIDRYSIPLYQDGTQTTYNSNPWTSWDIPGYLVLGCPGISQD